MELRSLIEKATKAGWSESEACTAIASLEDRHILASCANAKMMSEIAAQRTTGTVIKAQRR
ncbi:hypothetical protein [Shinella zoogloeoides]